MLDSAVGYTGSDSPAPTYSSVCAGDGHTEAVRVAFDPAALSFEALVREWLESPRVRSNYGSDDAQYQTAIWAQDDAQRRTALRVQAEVGKVVPVYGKCAWYDAEPNHQHFFGPPTTTDDARRAR